MSGVRRQFCHMPDGRHVHCRTVAGAGSPLVMLHASPGSALQLAPLMTALTGADRALYAPDTPGNGDSDPLAIAVPQIADYADALADWLDAMGLGQVDLYGSHTGANIAIETALRHPARVRRVVIDGLALYSDREQAEFLDRYAPEVALDRHGAHLLWAFHFCRDQNFFFPWYADTPERQRQVGLQPLPELHSWAVEVIKAIGTYHLAYRAAFRYDKRRALAALRHPALVLAQPDDPIARDRDTVAALARGDLNAAIRPSSIDGVARAIATFLA